MRFGIFYLVVQEMHTLIEIASLSFGFVSLQSFLMTTSPPLGNSIEKRGRACIYSSSQIPSLHHNHWWLGHMKLVDDLSPILPWLLHRSSISNFFLLQYFFYVTLMPPWFCIINSFMKIQNVLNIMAGCLEGGGKHLLEPPLMMILSFPNLPNKGVPRKPPVTMLVPTSKKYS